MLKIKVLGPGCPNCRMVEEHTRRALDSLHPPEGYDLVKVTDPVDISGYILKTPGLVINEKVVCEGRVPKASEIEKWLETAMDTI